MQAIFIYITCPSLDEARRVAAAVVEDRLAACANIIPGLQAVFHWEGKVEAAEECAVILKTRQELFPAVEARVKELHSYDAPCIAAVPLTAVSGAFLQWIFDETRP